MPFPALGNKYDIILSFFLYILLFWPIFHTKTGGTHFRIPPIIVYLYYIRVLNLFIMYKFHFLFLLSPFGKM